MALNVKRIAILAAALLIAIPRAAVPDELIKLEAYASYYGKEFDGKPTSSGETFDMNALTAAHKTLPFGTLLEVTNLSNGRRVIVRVNDRGPFVAGREIDLSFAAAIALDMIGSGIAKVSIRSKGMAPSTGTPPPPTAPDQTPQTTGTSRVEAPRDGAVTATESAWIVQIASFSNAENADALAAKLRSEGFESELERSGPYVRVVIKGTKYGDLELTRAKLAEKGYKDALVRRESR